MVLSKTAHNQDDSETVRRELLWKTSLDTLRRSPWPLGHCFFAGLRIEVHRLMSKGQEAVLNRKVRDNCFCRAKRFFDPCHTGKRFFSHARSNQRVGRRIG